MTRCDQDSPQVSSWDQDWSECRHVFNLASERWSMEVIWVYLQMFVNFLWTYLLMCWFKSLTLPPTIIGVKERWPQEVATFHLHDWWRRRMMFAIPGNSCHRQCQFFEIQQAIRMSQSCPPASPVFTRICMHEWKKHGPQKSFSPKS